MSLFIYTENYDPGGGNRYFVDFINSIPGGYRILVGTNPDGLSQRESESIRQDAQQIEVGIRKRRRPWSFRIPGVAGKLLRRLENGLVKASAWHIVEAKLAQRHNRRIFGTLLRRFGVDAVMGFDGGYPAATSVLDLMLSAEALGLPSLLSVVSMPARRSLSERLLYWKVPTAVRLLVANANAILDQLRKSRGFDGTRSMLVSNRVGVPPVRPEVRADNRDLIIGYVGRVEEAKGIRVLLEAFALLAGDLPNAKLVLVGKVYEKSKWHYLISNFGLAERTEVRGIDSRPIGTILSEFDVFVFPSLWEGMPIAVIEAMGHGLPVVATNVGGVGELISDGINGMLCKASSVSCLYSRMKELSTNRDLRIQIGGAGWMTAATRFDPAIHQTAVTNATARLFSQGLGMRD